MNKILLVGSANMDLSMNVYKMPERGETVLDDGGVAYTPGGKGANAAIALARLGGECVFCAKLGRDAHGQKLYSYYKECGINTSYIKVDPDAPTGLAAVIKEADGSNRIIVYPGANRTLNNDNIIEAFNSRPDALYLGFEIPFNMALAAAKIAAANNVPIFVDAAPASKEHPLESLPPVEIFSPNETETFEYTGVMPNGTDSCLQAAYSLFQKVKAKYIVIKLGARGAFFFDGKHFDLIPAYRPDEVVDTTAAGDTFTAAMTVEYLRTGNIREAIRFGAAAGAIAVSRKGAGTSVPTADEVKAFMSKR
ncbi:MAG: ribokinase [Ruminococcaceae bacterium]|nr:ribokinase [Oscillospiraceae bacterium]